MADKVTLMSKWFEDIKDDPNIDVTDQDLAYLIFAAAQYGFYGVKVDLGATFGREFRGLNMCMSNIYGQIDRIKGYDPREGKLKYDHEKIKELRLQGLTAKEICEELGIPQEKAKSLSTTKGWLEAKKLLESNAEGYTEDTDSVYDAAGKMSKKIEENTDFGQIQTENTDLSKSVKFEF